MEIRDFSNMDGELISTDVQLAMSPVNNTPENGIYYYAGGGKPKTTAGKIAQYHPYGIAYNLLKGSPEGQKRRQAARQQRRDAKTGSKTAYAQAQLEAAKNMGKETSLDKALAGSLGAKKSGGSKGISTMVWVGIGVGVLAVAIGGFFLVRKMGKGKK